MFILEQNNQNTYNPDSLDSLDSLGILGGVRAKPARKDKIMTKGKIVNIGDKFISNKGYEYEVINKLKGGKYEVRFKDTGYIAKSDKKEVLNGCIRDWEAPYVVGIGIVGKEIDHPQKHYLYDRWRDMLRRCYDNRCNSYCTYGAVGVTVDEKWFRFINYVNDIETKENFEKLKIKNCGWEIDKDLKGNGTKIYSNATTSIIREEENIKERNIRQDNPAIKLKIKVMQFTTEGNFIKTHESITEAMKFIGVINGSGSCIIDCCKSRAKTAYGFAWMYEKDFIDFESARIKIIHRLEYIPDKYRKIVLKMDNDYNIIDEFKGLKRASESLGATVGAIANAITRGNKCKGFIVRYKEE